MIFANINMERDLLKQVNNWIMNCDGGSFFMATVTVIQEKLEKYECNNPT